ncbi:SCO family protein [Dictyobacter kobayashii]|uniref:Thioredoxin domain-containing protein n=1 Tax=Dictyobacter kobayashii TaxID=2014872 RepID=A0A402ANK7_9CHLR|nr:SCO family protein [Dictyobacter kobayashii]GCE20778.1 hypothetical protein KDK_45780 [Dictyobacter kobayashii]
MRNVENKERTPTEDTAVRVQGGRVRTLTLLSFSITFVLIMLLGALWGSRLLFAARNQAPTAEAINSLGGFPLPGKAAPDFTLVNQFNQPVTLSTLRGREVVLAFIDARCTTLCPLTAEIMYNAKAQLKPAEASKVVLVAVNANPAATSVTEVQSWSIKHGMLHQWLFLTGTSQQLQAIYHQYNVYDQVSTNVAVVHDPTMFIIDAQGRSQLYYETLDSSLKADLSSEENGLLAGMRHWLPQL